MAEIRLICPSCAAEYRVPDTAIPADGREVECSACGNVWHATARPGPLALAAALSPETAPAETPRLSRRLPDSVLDILRDEVEHERRARAAEEGALPPAEAPAAPRPAVDPEWPATTITRHIEPKTPEAAPLLPRPVPKTPVFENPPKSARPEPAARPETPPEHAPVAEPAPPPQPAPSPETTAPLLPAPVPARERGGYGAGFGLAMALATACVALYVLAPVLADQGAFGEGLMQLRGHADQARLWLRDGVASLTR